MTSPNASSNNEALLAVHAMIHARLEDALYAAMDALVNAPADLARARTHVGEFAELLAAHMRIEDDVVMPVYRAHAPAEGAGRADHVEGDHTILRRHVETLHALMDAFTAIEGGPTRREVLAQLPPFYRAIGTLEHHTAREQTHVYPAFSVAAPERVDALVVELSALTALIRGA